MMMDLYVHITNEVKDSEMLLLLNELGKICVDSEYINKLFEASQEPASNVYNVIAQGWCDSKKCGQKSIKQWIHGRYE